VVMNNNAGQANVDFNPPGLICLRGACGGNTQCVQRCVSSGHGKGGSCVGFIPGVILCCCYKWLMMSCRSFSMYQN